MKSGRTLSGAGTRLSALKSRPRKRPDPTESPALPSYPVLMGVRPRTEKFRRGTLVNSRRLALSLAGRGNLMICRRTESNDILLELVAKTLAVGAYEMQVEYEDRKEHVLAFQEGVGFGIASLDASSEEAQALREALYQIRRKQKIVTIEGVEYRLRARIHQSFGEDVFRVTIKKG